MISSSRDLLCVIGFSREHGYTETGNYMNQVQDASHTCFGEILKTWEPNRNLFFRSIFTLS